MVIYFSCWFLQIKQHVTGKELQLTSSKPESKLFGREISSFWQLIKTYFEHNIRQVIMDSMGMLWMVNLLHFTKKLRFFFIEMVYFRSYWSNLDISPTICQPYARTRWHLWDPNPWLLDLWILEAWLPLTAPSMRTNK